MRATQFSWREGRAWDRVSADDLRADLVLYFGSRQALDDGRRYDELRAMFPRAHLVGCSTGGQISGGDLTDDAVAATALSFDATRLRVACAPAQGSDCSRTCGRTIGRALADDGLAGVFVLSDGLTVNGSELVAGIMQEVGAAIPVTGGLAGDGAQFERTLVGADCAPGPGTVAAVGFYGRAVRIGHGSAGGWDEFGPRRSITRSQGNVLHELDGRPALDLYMRYLGEEAAKGLPGTALLFPLKVFDPDRPEHDIVRTVLSVDHDNGTMTFAGDLPQGWTAQLMRGSFDRLAQGAGDAARQAADGLNGSRGDKVAVLVSCIGRRLLMGQRTLDEIEAVGTEFGPDVAQIGFYSYGEISPHWQTGLSELHNQTMTVTTLAEAAG